MPGNSCGDVFGRTDLAKLCAFRPGARMPSFSFRCAFRILCDTAYSTKKKPRRNRGERVRKAAGLGEDFEGFLLPRLAGQDLGAVNIFQGAGQSSVTSSEPDLVEVHPGVDSERAECVL